MTKFYALVLAMLTSVVVLAQANPGTRRLAAPAATLSPNPAAPAAWNLTYQHLGIYHGDNYAQLGKDAQKHIKHLPATAGLPAPPEPLPRFDVSAGAGSASELVATPALDLAFPGNRYNGWVPPDNHIAVSRAGAVVSVVNSGILVTDTLGNRQFESSFGDLFAYLDLPGFYFDPRILYDAAADRFVLILCSGSTPASSNMLVCFSQTNDPTGDWTPYVFPGDELERDEWFDYPSVALTAEDVVISGNIFDEDNGFQYARLYQIAKREGYAGEEAPTRIFNEITAPFDFRPGTLVPVGHGLGMPTESGVHLITSLNTFDGIDLMVYGTLAGSAYDDGPLELDFIEVPSYALSGDGLQNGTTDLMSTNDVRVQSAFYLGDTLHFAMHTDIGAGYTGIYYGKLNTTTLATRAGTYGLIDYDYAYPSIVPLEMGEDGAASVLVNFSRTGADIFPEMRAVVQAGDFAWSESVLVKQGESYVDRLRSDVERWGDYSGVARWEVGDRVEIWAAGSYGSKRNAPETWIGKLSASEPLAPPVAGFTASLTELSEGETSTFTAVAGGGAVDARRWLFPGGNPATATGREVTVTYDSQGVYDVSLIVENRAGEDVLIRSDFIMVVPQALQPQAALAGPRNATVGDTIQFTDESVHLPTSWSWRFAGGRPATSTEADPTVVYDEPGTYAVSLSVSNEAGTDSIYLEDYLTIIPRAQVPATDFTASATEVDARDTVRFSDLSGNEPTEWRWVFPGAEPPLADVANPRVVYPTAGTYDVILIAANAAGADTLRRQAHITVRPEVFPPAADLLAPRRATVGDTVYFADRSTNAPTSWSWTFPGGQPGSSDERHPRVVYDSAGTYDVALRVSNRAGSDSLSWPDYLTVEARVVSPIADFAADRLSVEVGDTVRLTDLSLNDPTAWAWTFPGGTPATDTVQQPWVVYEAPGVYDIRLETSNTAGSSTIVRTGYVTVDQATSVWAPSPVTGLRVFPNPTDGAGQISAEFELPHALPIDFHLVDSQGRLVKRLLQHRARPGWNRLSFNGRMLARGLYYLVLQSPRDRQILGRAKIIVN